VSNASAGDFAIPASEYATRRAAVAELIGEDSILLLFSPRPAHRNGDVSWPFHQEDNLYYLTGVAQPGTVLVLLPGEEAHREILFARDRDPRAEAWNGRIPTHEELSEMSGIEEIASPGDFSSLYRAAFEGGWWGETDLYRYYRPHGLPHFYQGVQEGRATVWMLLENRPGKTDPLSKELRQVEDLRKRYPELKFRDVTPLIQAMREVKSPAEIEILQRAIDITVAAQKAAMRRTLTASHEYQVQATLEFVFRDLGGCCWGYPSIVASGENATTLHYPENDAPIPADGLMLIDAGAEVGGYTADITRTFPVTGTFAEPQREIYEAVLKGWEESLPLIRSGKLFKEAHLRSIEVLGEELLKLGLIRENVQEQVELYYLHGLGHPVGMNVHDVFDRSRPFEPGMVVTLEPGLYIRKDDVLASGIYTGLPEEDRESIAQALDRYAGIGVRIEDDILVTNGDPKVLSADLPRSVAAIEALLATTD